jgi:hypothetical protein
MPSPSRMPTLKTFFIPNVPKAREVQGCDRSSLA